ncbi:hypothetical protein [Streptomyces tremellae]|uniref:Uncharacterized protein n=1 Tax=Streptomyces tremellae TaxID=1124239 RepID=A0ABP7FCR9_9ACTN
MQLVLREPAQPLAQRAETGPASLDEAEEFGTASRRELFRLTLAPPHHRVPLTEVDRGFTLLHDRPRAS